MNIRIDKKQIRFRITKEEFTTLQNKEILTMESPLSKNPQNYNIIISDKAESIAIAEQENNLFLLVNRRLLMKLGNNLPSKDGIEDEILINNQLIKVTLEVDLKTKIKK